MSRSPSTNAGSWRRGSSRSSTIRTSLAVPTVTRVCRRNDASDQPTYLPVAFVESAQGLVEGTFEPREVVGLAVVVGHEVVGAAGGGVADVVEPTVDEGADVVESLRVGHRPRPGAGDVDGRGVGEHGAAPFV